jgi:hypothetical protein
MPTGQVERPEPQKSPAPLLNKAFTNDKLIIASFASKSLEMKKAAISILALTFAIAACKKKETTEPAPDSHELTVFTEKDGKEIPARVYMKAGTAAPADTSQYDKKALAQQEPGFGYHVHFRKLSAGTYYVMAMDGNAKEDTTITINATDPAEVMVTLKLK